MSIAETAKELRGLGRFRHYTNMELEHLASIGKRVDNKAGQTLFLEGHPGDSFCVVLHGRYETRRRNNGSKQGEINALEPGDIAGEMCVLDPNSPHRGADVLARTDGAVLLINRASLDEAVNRGESWAAKLMTHFAETLAGRLRELDAAYTKLWKDTRGRDHEVTELQAFRNTLREKWKL